MKYVATVEIEFETDVDPHDILHGIMSRTMDAFSFSSIGVSPGYADDYHIVEQPKELK